MPNTEPSVYTDKCARCETYVLTGSRADLARRMHAHELQVHGHIQLASVDHEGGEH